VARTGSQCIMNPNGTDVSAENIARLKRQLERERQARLDAEAISERSLRELYKQKEEANLVARIASLANEGLEIESVFQHALDAICQHAECTQASAFLVGLDQQELRQIEFNKTNEMVFSSANIRAAGRILFELKLPRLVLIEKRPIWIENLTEDFAQAQSGGPCSGSLFAVPVMVGSTIGAVLVFYSLAERPMDQKLLELLTQIGIQLGRALERYNNEALLKHEARHDPLTQLANRRQFQESLERAITTRPALIGVILIDLERFKLINDSLGHNAGDELLIAVARRIEDVLKESAMNMRYLLARMGGDEFTVLLMDIPQEATAFQLAEAIRRKMNAPYRLRESSIYSPASLGLALAKDGNAEDLMRNADIALYRAKLQGRGRTEIFEPAMHTAAVDQLKLESDLRDALASGEFAVYYQPTLNLKTRQIQGFEALIRWHHEGQLVPPEDFIPLCEETGVIVFIGEWVLDQICDDIKIMQATHPDASALLTVSLNISPRQFMQDNFAEYILHKLREENIPPSKLCLEVTEAVMIEDLVRAQIIFGALRAHGIKIGIDDFGKGYSSLNYLRQLPADILKIDGSFTSAMAVDKGSYEVVDLILQLAKRLSLKTIAEGIEDEAADRLLREIGCDSGQGYFYGKPAPLSQALDMLGANRN